MSAPMFHAEAAPDGGFPLRPFIEDLSVAETVILHRLVRSVFASPSRFGFDSADDAAGAFLKYASRLRSIVRKGASLGESRHAYLDSCMRYLARSMKRSARKKESMNVVLEDAGKIQYEAGLSASDPAEAGGNVLEEDSADFVRSLSPKYFLARMEPDSKRLLCLIVKCAGEIDDEMAVKAARKLGLPLPWLGALLGEARGLLEPVRLRIAGLNEKINLVWVKSRLLEARLLEMEKDSPSRPDLEKRLRRLDERYRALFAKRSRTRPVLSNSAVAGILGIPKGTVDSGLYYLRAKRGAKLAEEVPSGVGSSDGHSRRIVQ